MNADLFNNIENQIIDVINNIDNKANSTHAHTAGDISGLDTTPTMVTQIEAETGTLTTIKSWSPERVKQAVVAQTDRGMIHRVFQQTTTVMATGQVDFNVSSLNLIRDYRYIELILEYSPTSITSVGNQFNGNWRINGLSSGYFQYTGTGVATANSNFISMSMNMSGDINRRLICVMPIYLHSLSGIRFVIALPTTVSVYTNNSTLLTQVPTVTMGDTNILPLAPTTDISSFNITSSNAYAELAPGLTLSIYGQRRVV